MPRMRAGCRAQRIREREPDAAKAAPLDELPERPRLEAAPVAALLAMVPRSAGAENERPIRGDDAPELPKRSHQLIGLDVLEDVEAGDHGERAIRERDRRRGRHPDVSLRDLHPCGDGRRLDWLDPRKRSEAPAACSREEPPRAAPDVEQGAAPQVLRSEQLERRRPHAAVPPVIPVDRRDSVVVAGRQRAGSAHVTPATRARTSMVAAAFVLHEKRIACS